MDFPFAMHVTLLVFAFVWGAIWGSFLNVVIWRLPRGKNLSRPASACPTCGHAIRWHDNVPIFGWMWLGGRCRDCKTGISPRYPAIELLVGLLSVALWWHVSRGRLAPETVAPAVMQFLLHFYFVASLVAIAFIDLDLTIIPHKLSMPLIAWGLLGALISPKTGVWVDYFPGIDLMQSLIGFAAGFGLLFAVFGGYKLVRGIDGGGGGDLWLLGAIGANLGVLSIAFVLFAASFQGLLAALVSSLIDRIRGRSAGAGEGLLIQGAHTEAYWEHHPVLGGSGDSETTREPYAVEGGDADREPDIPSDAQTRVDELGQAEPPAGVPGDEGFLKLAVPFGPFLALAAVEYIFVGAPVLRWLSSGWLP